MTAPAWDCYSPVALVLWAAADEAEFGNVTWAVSDAGKRLGLSRYTGPAVTMADPLRHRPQPHEHRGWAVHLRNLAEFGPAGRPR